ncbi:MAG: cellulase family glycosylhydrolase [Chloroflexota bacterium]
MSRLHIDGARFRDEEGRIVMLRGVNLAGSSKVPRAPNGATHRREGFFNHRHVSFVGRPFPLEEADEHFARLRAWGFNFLRFLVTWEAIEHAGPGRYDEAYLDYVARVVRMAGDYGFRVLIDPHQDVWSRFSGGDGAPGWTLEVVGFELRNLHATRAAFLHQVHGDPLPRMIWPTNATKLAAATMFTLFFAGEVFAPRTRIEGEGVQEYLQRHYLAAMQQLALRLRGLDHVLGYGTMNEPWRGYIGWQDLTVPRAIPWVGEIPSPFQSMLLGSGIAQEVEVYTMGPLGPRRVGKRQVNLERLRAWQAGVECLWRQNGVWDVTDGGQPVLLRPQHFSQVAGRPADFTHDFLRPFAKRYAQAIREIEPQAYIFLETEPFADPPRWLPEDGRDVVFAPHWYDGYVLFMKDFRSWIAAEGPSGRLVFGAKRIRRAFAEQLRVLQESAAERMGPTPVVIGEFGIPFDLRRGRAFGSGDFRLQVRAMDRSFRAMEDALADCALWNYTPDNDNIHGDQWNGEDFSIFSRGQQHEPDDLNSGGRALEAVVRPYPESTSGVPQELRYDLHARTFEYAFTGEKLVGAPMVLRAPSVVYPRGFTVEVTDGRVQVDGPGERVLYWPDPAGGEHRIQLRPAG